MDLNKDYYKILGVDKNATKEEIKKAYRKLSMKHHPDKGGNEDDFRNISEAYDILNNKKDSYDVKSPHGKNPQSNFGGFGGNQGFGGINIEDLFNGGFSSFGNSGFGNSSFGSSFYFEEDLNAYITFEPTLEEIYNNTPKTIKYKREASCNACNGTGVNTKSEANCGTCNGKGRVRYPNGMEGLCPKCNGKGKVYSKCGSCNGTGTMKVDEITKIDFFYLAWDKRKKSISKKGKGNFSKQRQGLVGDLVVTLIPKSHKDYKQVNFDLYYNLKVNVKTAILGGSVKYKHLDGKTLNIEIPKRTNNKDKFILEGKGLMRDRKGIRGDLYMIVDLEIDYNSLTEKDLELINDIKF